MSFHRAMLSRWLSITAFMDTIWSLSAAMVVSCALTVHSSAEIS
jgi:hypothetical protein